ncbi:MAG: hypothetical protein M0Z94_05880 [Dehalococcoidales bacterium]|nr:hypothetical protein [Dehalococcoidales bacterium]
MQRILMRVDATTGSTVAAGTGVRKGQYLGRGPGRQGEPVLSPVDGVVENVLNIAEQQAYVLILRPLEVGSGQPVAAR